jgi:pimeloyl-ACP methyl ester carboxylesterase
MSEIQKPRSEKEPQKQEGSFEWRGIQLQTITVMPAEIESKKIPLVCMIGGIPRGKENSPDFHPLNSGTFEAYANEFARRGEASFVMSPVGMGASGGDTFEHSIGDRIDAWVQAVERLARDPRFDQEQITLLGNSMGGHIAIKVAEILATKGINIKSLILVSPAAYPDELEKVNFGSQWGEAAKRLSGSRIRVFEALEDFKGRVLLSWAQSDRPISIDKQKLYNKVLSDRMRRGRSDTAMSQVAVEHNFRKLNSNPTDNIIEISSLNNAAKVFADWQLAK